MKHDTSHWSSRCRRKTHTQTSRSTKLWTWLGEFKHFFFFNIKETITTTTTKNGINVYGILASPFLFKPNCPPPPSISNGLQLSTREEEVIDYKSQAKSSSDMMERNFNRMQLPSHHWLIKTKRDEDECSQIKRYQSLWNQIDFSKIEKKKIKIIKNLWTRLADSPQRRCLTCNAIKK